MSRRLVLCQTFVYTPSAIRSPGPAMAMRATTLLDSSTSPTPHARNLHHYFYEYLIRLARWRVTHAHQHHHGSRIRVVICEEEKGTAEERVW